MTETKTIWSGGAVTTLAVPTMGLRWHGFGRERRLQQGWLITVMDKDGHRLSHSEWRDVPESNEL